VLSFYLLYRFYLYGDFISLLMNKQYFVVRLSFHKHKFFVHFETINWILMWLVFVIQSLYVMFCSVCCSCINHVKIDIIQLNWNNNCFIANQNVRPNDSYRYMRLVCLFEMFIYSPCLLTFTFKLFSEKWPL
jgi:hypothetical protein